MLKYFQKSFGMTNLSIALTKSWLIFEISKQYYRKILTMRCIEYLHFHHSVFEYIYEKSK